MPRNNEMKVVMTLPDMGLSQTAVNKLKNKFKAQTIESLGGKAALARRRIVVVIIVIIVVSSLRVAPVESRTPRRSTRKSTRKSPSE